jgi:O-succinylbenzoate synthase
MNVLLVEELAWPHVILVCVQVDRIRLVTVPVELSAPLRTSDGIHQSRSATLIEITDSQGFVGWGENVAPTGVHYVGESHDESVRVMREQLVATLVSRDVSVEEMNPHTWWGVEGFVYAKHSLESAVWDVHARSQHISLKNLLGGTRDTIVPGVVVGISDTIDEVVAECLHRYTEGYRRIKLKISPGHDIDVVRHVRGALGDECLIQVDANGAYTVEHIEHLGQLAKFNIQFIEQPFAHDDIAAHIELVRAGSVPVCMDESISSRTDLVHMLDSGACTIVNIKPSRVGGIGEAVAMHDIVRERGVDAWVGGMLETGIGRASCLALASLPGFTMTPDLSASHRYFVRDITEPFEMNDGCLRIPEGPGIGVVPLFHVLDDDVTRIETVFER